MKTIMGGMAVAMASIAAAPPADASPACLTWRQFSAIEHKVKVRPHCWRAVERPQHTPAIDEPVEPDFNGDIVPPGSWPELEPDAPYAIGPQPVPPPAPETFRPGWEPAASPWQPQAVQVVAAQDAPPTASGAHWLRVLGAAVAVIVLTGGVLAGAARRKADQRRALDRRLVPRVVTTVLPNSHVRVAIPPVSPFRRSAG